MRAPILSRRQAQTGQVGIQTRATPAAFGAGAAQGLDQVGRAILQREQELAAQKQRADAVSARNALNEQVRVLRYGEDGKGGYYAKQGRDADEGRADYEAAIDKAYSDIAGTLDEDTRSVYDQLVQNRLETVKDQGAQYALQQRQAYQAGVNNAAVASSQSDLIEDINDPQAVADTLLNIRAYTEAATQGQAPEAVDLLVQKNQSQGLSAGITAAIERGDLARAREVYEQYGDSLTATDKDAVEKLLTAGDDAAQSQEIIDTVMQQFGGNQKEGLAYIRSNASGKLEDDLVKRYKARLGEIEVNEMTQKEQLLGQAEALNARGISVDEWPIPLRVQLGERAVTLYREAQEGRPPETDWGYFTELKGMSADAVARIDPEDARQSLSDREYREFLSMREQALNPDTDTSKSLGTPLMTSINAAFEANKVKDRHRSEAMTAINQSFEEFQGTNGRQPTPVERDELIAREIAKVKIRGGGGNQRRFEVEEIGDIPEEYTDAVLDVMGDKFSVKKAEAAYTEAIEFLASIDITEPSPDVLALTMAKMAAGELGGADGR